MARFGLFLLCLVSTLTANEWSLTQDFVRSYVHHSEMQRRWAMAFLAETLKELRGNEHILDIGSGDGKVTADVSRFVPRGKVIGIDPSEAMLGWANKQFGACEYPNLAFKKGDFLKPNLDGTFDLIISTCAFQHCPDQIEAMNIITKLLKQGGKLCIMMPALNNKAWKEAYQQVEALPKWSTIKKASPGKFLTVESALELLSQTDFKVIRVENVPTQDCFVDREELHNFLCGTMTPGVSREKLSDFFLDLIDIYLYLLPEATNEEGVIEIRLGRIEIEAKKNERIEFGLY